MKKISTGVYVSATGQFGVLRKAEDRRIKMSLQYYAVDFMGFDAEYTHEQDMPYDFIYKDVDSDHYQYLILNDSDAACVLDSWSFLGPLNSKFSSRYADAFLKVGTIWKDHDERLDRFIEVLEIGDYYVTIQNIHTGRITQASRTRFDGGDRNYRLSNIQNKKKIKSLQLAKKHSKKKGK